MLVGVTEFDLAAAAVDAALAAGARYAEVDDLSQQESSGLGVRALVGSSWGFFASPDPDHAADTGRRAAEIANASARVAGPPLDLVDVPVRQDSWANAYRTDPGDVPISDKGDLLVAATKLMTEHGADLAQAGYSTWDTSSWLVSSQGHRIDQRIVECGGQASATAMGVSESQRRSHGDTGTRGWELVDELDLLGNAPRLGEEAKALLTAPECPAGTTDLILGWEAAFAGTSWLDLVQLGSLRYGSDLMNITADPTIPGALGSFGYDDEGTPARARDIVRDGIWVGVLAGRDSAALAGLDYAGSVRADGWARLPMVRMTNVGLKPGPHTLEEIIAATDDGVFMDTNRSWSIDDRRLNFQFGCEIGWEVRNGKRGRMLRNPTYTGIGPTFWRSMDMLSSEVHAWGTPNCGKGQPSQIGHTGHPAAPARFKNVRVGVRA